MTVKPTSQTLTLRLKNRKITVLLFVERTQSFDQIAADLLVVLRQRYDDHLPTGEPIPSDPTLVKFARYVDEAEPDEGWAPIPVPQAAESAETDNPKRRKSAGKKGVLEGDCPLAYELRDASILAFRFAAEGGDEAGGTWEVDLPGFEDEDAIGADVADGEDIEIPDIDQQTF